MIKLVLIENTDNESDKTDNHFILDAANKKVPKTLVIKSQHKLCHLNNVDIIKEKEVDLQLKTVILATNLTFNDKWLIGNVTGGLIQNAEERKDSANVFEHSKIPRTERNLKQIITNNKNSKLNNFPCPKTIKYGIMVKDAVKTSS